MCITQTRRYLLLYCNERHNIIIRLPYCSWNRIRSLRIYRYKITRLVVIHYRQHTIRILLCCILGIQCVRKLINVPQEWVFWDFPGKVTHFPSICDNHNPCVRSKYIMFFIKTVINRTALPNRKTFWFFNRSKCNVM